MKIKDLLKSITFAIIMVLSGMSVVSCSEETVMDPETPSVNPSESDIKPGDNFYMYVNGKWHQELVPTNPEHGFMTDAAREFAIKANIIMQQSEECELIMQALDKFSDNEAEAVTKVNAIIENLLGNVKTKEDVYHALGKSIKMGLNKLIKPYLSHDDSQICITLLPANAMAQSNKHSLINLENYSKLKLTRSGEKQSIVAILEGMEIDTEQYQHENTLDSVLLEQLNNLSFEQLRDTVAHSIRAALLPYCADRYAHEYSKGSYETTEKYIDAELMEHLKYPVSYDFINDFISEERIETFKEYGEEIRSTFAKRIENNTWLTEPTKQKALEKLNAMTMNYARPEEWPEEGFPELKGDLLLDDMLELMNSRFRLINAMIGWDKRKGTLLLLTYIYGGTTLYSYNSFYVPSLNAMCILPAFMMEPNYKDNVKTSEKYASLWVLGHEMTHGFDYFGSKYDHNGMDNNWWTTEDSSEFERLNKMLIEQFNSFEVAPGIFANGERTVGENGADLGGLIMLYETMCEKLKEDGITSEEELAEEKRNFFITYAKRLCWWMNETRFNVHLNDNHSLPMLRVNGIVQHMDCWYELFNVQEGDSLYLPKDKRVKIW